MLDEDSPTLPLSCRTGRKTPVRVPKQLPADISDLALCHGFVYGYYSLPCLRIDVPIQACQAAYECAGIIHRDISSGNVLLVQRPGGKWEGLLNDWELSKLVCGDEETMQRQPDRTVSFSSDCVWNARLIDVSRALGNTCL